ncbi:MAG: hypothetical protein AB1813_06305 [Verrucomicrobiota bacterium]
MKKSIVKAGLFLSAVLACQLPARALDITVYDGNSTSPGWYGGQEDNETEPNTIIGQTWDMEAFVVQGTYLYMIGGFDFVNGNSGFKSGDIFIDTNNSFSSGPLSPGQFEPNSSYGYEIVLDLDFSALTYVARVLSGASVLETVTFDQLLSNPWRYSSGDLGTLASGLLTYQTGLTDAQIATLYGIALSGGSHNVVGIDMSWYSNPNLATHFTMQCGNDNLVGKIGGGITVPDGGMTVMLLGMGLAGLAVAARRMKRA